MDGSQNHHSHAAHLQFYHSFLFLAFTILISLCGCGGSFGSDIAEPREINLTVELSKRSDGSIQSRFAHSEPFVFSALLSIYLDKEWTAQSATAYRQDTAVASVSLTGSKTTILNMTLDGSHAELVIRPDELPEEETTPSEPEAATEPPKQDDYLSDVTDSGSQVYTDGKDKYLTDPIPEGKPKPVEPEDQDCDLGNDVGGKNLF